MGQQNIREKVKPMATARRLTAITLFISRFRTPKPEKVSLNLTDYGISGDELIKREGSWGFTPEGLAEMKAAIDKHHESADADA